MHAVVFGASGPVGLELLKLLSKNGIDTSAVSRTGTIPSLKDSPLPHVTAVAGDALDAARTLELCSGASTIYCTIGLPYDSSVWKSQWPVIVDNLLAAAGASGATLVFADNLYCFGREHEGKPLLEASTDFTTQGRKPVVRAELNRRMLKAHAEGTAKVAIVRASDFFGPGVLNSVALGSTVLPPVLSGRRGPMGTALFIAAAQNPHSVTYVPDFAAALLAVALEPSAWGRAWHAPCTADRSPVQLLERAVELENARRTTAAKQQGAGSAQQKKAQQQLKVRWTQATGMLGGALRVLVPIMREMPEMRYMWDSEFRVDHADFSGKFPALALATPLDEALLSTLDWYKAQAKQAQQQHK